MCIVRRASAYTFKLRSAMPRPPESPCETAKSLWPSGQQREFLESFGIRALAGRVSALSHALGCVGGATD